MGCFFPPHNKAGKKGNVNSTSLFILINGTVSSVRVVVGEKYGNEAGTGFS